VSTRQASPGAERRRPAQDVCRFALAILVTTVAIVLEAVGSWHLLVWREWRGGTSLGLMVLGCFALVIASAVAPSRS
jgi:hypothetical protein